jgi:hypothetical protein
MSKNKTFNLVDFIRTPIKYFQDTYKHYVHVEKEGSYPILERFIAYGLPTAAALGFGYSKPANFNQYQNIKLEAPAAFAGYLVSQFVVTSVKPHVESMDKGVFKSVANFIVKTLDNVNDLILYVPAYNLLPETKEFNTAFAFFVLPAMVKGVESDFSSWWNGKDYEGEVAGRVYAEAIAGGVAANLSAITTESLQDAVAKQLSNDAKHEVTFNNEQMNSFNSKNAQAKLASTAVDTISYSLIKKLLVGQKYESDELKNDFARTIFKDALKGTKFISDFEAKSVKGSIFENSIYAFGSTMGLQIVEDFLGLLEDQEIKDAIADAKILPDISTEF